MNREIRWGDLVYLKETWEAKHGRNHSGVRIKREDSDGSFEVYDEEANGTPQGEPTSAEGYRVSVCALYSPTYHLSLTLDVSDYQDPRRG